LIGGRGKLMNVNEGGSGEGRWGELNEFSQFSFPLLLPTLMRFKGV